MLIYYEQTRGGVLHAMFDPREFTDEPFKTAHFRRWYGPRWSVIFTFEKNEQGFYLFVSLDRREKNAGTSCYIVEPRSSEGYDVLWTLAHLTGANLLFKHIEVIKGRGLKLFNGVGFRLRQDSDVYDGVWHTWTDESEFDRANRQIGLDEVRKLMPGLVRQSVLGPPVAPGMQLLFGDPDVRECSWCLELVDSAGLKEIRPWRFACESCQRDLEFLEGEGISPDEVVKIGDLTCETCGEDLTESDPGFWICMACYERKLREKS